eukprot:CAMPEP_0118970458 /NCGR_PEP_ID=MMETSP1173-20130426/7361_1 /TAXON_ID=1034831 /ORGANISM="Rhizochromulina marina cf, Strain CCMP1243" /LENGTH=114 /DNA_ID=CAMNT_0006919829 /DNA_START=170 /DNA_END=511 /DNA_ORIENTATION=+
MLVQGHVKSEKPLHCFLLVGGRIEPVVTGFPPGVLVGVSMQGGRIQAIQLWPRKCPGEDLDTRKWEGASARESFEEYGQYARGPIWGRAPWWLQHSFSSSEFLLSVRFMAQSAA